MRSVLFLAVALSTAFAQGLPQSQVELLARAVRQKNSAENRAALTTYAAQHRTDTPGAIALLALGATASGDEAVAHFKMIQGRLAPIRDYLQFLTAREQLSAKDFAGAARTVEQAFGSGLASPVAGRALLVGGRAYWKAGDTRQALRFLEQHQARLPQPGGNLLWGQVLEEAGQASAAVQAYRRAYLESPRSKEAEEAEAALTRLGALANLPAADRLKRAHALVDASDWGRGVKELSALLPALTARDRDYALTRMGYAEFRARNYTAAFQRLKSFEAADAAVDAERLHHLMNTASRLGRYAEALTFAGELRQKHPGSVWRLQALITAGDHFYTQNDRARSESVFEECASAFTVPGAAYCDWRTAFARHLSRRPQARQDLEDHLKKFPASPHASAALYFLGRLAEEARDSATAKAYFQRAARVYPNHFYAMLARERLQASELARAVPAPAAQAFLDGIPWPPLPARPALEVSPANRARQERANLLAQAALDEFVDGEMRAGATEQPAVTAMLLAEFAQRRGEPEKGIRAIKGLYPAYFSLPLEEAPFQFWQLAYPMPWRSQLESLAKEQDLDPYMVAGLIRQESEFDAEAISYANARGLTQVMPATGFDLSRRIGLKGYHTGQLFSPEVNLKLGTFYMRWLLDRVDSSPAFMLASYNAGKSRVDNWRGIYQFREPAEFIESIPLDQTRHYVQVVLRNADFYRRLYAGRPDAYTLTPAARPVPPAPPAPVVRKAAPKRPAAKAGALKTKGAQKKSPTR